MVWCRYDHFFVCSKKNSSTTLSRGRGTFPPSEKEKNNPFNMVDDARATTSLTSFWPHPKKFRQWRNQEVSSMNNSDCDRIPNNRYCTIQSSGRQNSVRTCDERDREKEMNSKQAEIGGTGPENQEVGRDETGRDRSVKKAGRDSTQAFFCSSRTGEKLSFYEENDTHPMEAKNSFTNREYLLIISGSHDWNAWLI